MTARPEQQPSDTARLEVRALERMVRAMCEHAEQLSHELRARAEGASREADLQLQAFDERRAQAREALESDPREPLEIRITRLERLVEALDCSRTFFRTDEAAEAEGWKLLVR